MLLMLKTAVFKLV